MKERRRRGYGRNAQWDIEKKGWLLNYRAPKKKKDKELGTNNRETGWDRGKTP